MRALQNGIANSPYAARYVRQLAKHWGHRFVVTETEAGYHIDFGDGSQVTLAPDDTQIHISLSGPAEDMAMLRSVTEEHIDRFAHRQGGLTYHWHEVMAV